MGKTKEQRPIVDSHITVDGVRIAYSLSGNGPPVVLLHGWACNRRFWDEQVRSLSKTHRVLAPDFRGHGESEAPEDGYTLKRLAGDVHAVMSALEMRPAAVIGHSMGGMVVQQLAATHPRDLSALALVATAAADPERQLISGRIASEAVVDGYRTTLERYFPGWFSQDADPEMKEWVRFRMLMTPERVALGLADDYKDLDFRGDLPRINVPALVIGAASDGSAVPARSEEIARLIPRARLVVISGAGHFVQLERPVEVNAAIGEFLTENGL